MSSPSPTCTAPALSVHLFRSRRARLSFDRSRTSFPIRSAYLSVSNHVTYYALIEQKQFKTASLLQTRVKILFDKEPKELNFCHDSKLHHLFYRNKLGRNRRAYFHERMQYQPINRRIFINLNQEFPKDVSIAVICTFGGKPGSPFPVRHHRLFICIRAEKSVWISAHVIRPRWAVRVAARG